MTELKMPRMNPAVIHPKTKSEMEVITSQLRDSFQKMAMHYGVRMVHIVMFDETDEALPVHMEVIGSVPVRPGAGPLTKAATDDVAKALIVTGAIGVAAAARNAVKGQMHAAQTLRDEDGNEMKEEGEKSNVVPIGPVN